MKKRYAVALTMILIVGIGLRAYHFSDWLIFKSDQARDALIMDQAMHDGIASLPLLGPEAGSTKFRLGPISYYFQYASGKFFHGTAESFAYPDLIFGILTIPVLFLLFRRFFTPLLSLWLTALASASLLLVTFSRFSWNPNGLPFFTTLFVLLFLLALDRQNTSRKWFLIGSAVCAGIIAQLHLVAILGLVIGLIAFLISSQSLRPKELLMCMLVAFSLQLPLLAYEWQTNGSNSQTFVRAATGERYKNIEHAWYEKVFRGYQESARVTWLITTGQQNTDTILTKGLIIKCDKKCREALPFSVAAIILFSTGIISMYRSWRFELNQYRKSAIAFMGWWLIGFSSVIMLVAYETETRFYLGIIPPLFILLGLTIENILGISQNIWFKKLLIAIGIILIAINLQATTKYLSELAQSRTSAEDSGRDLRFGTEAKVTLGQLRDIGKETERQLPKEASTIIFGESHHVKSMYYVLTREFGYTGCYLRGKQKGLSESFNTIFIEEYRPSEPEGLTPFGTLGASFKAASVEQKSPLPEKCLTY